MATPEELARGSDSLARISEPPTDEEGEEDDYYYMRGWAHVKKLNQCDCMPRVAIFKISLMSFFV